MIWKRMGIRSLASVREQITKEMNSFSNIQESILCKVDRKLLNIPNHPLQILSSIINSHLKSRHNYKIVKDLSPVVSVADNFERLLIPSDHVSRNKSDTYYVNEEKVLRCHTSAHQSQVMRQNGDGFLVYGDVYRRDEIDQTHYPIFHQLEGIRMFSKNELAIMKRTPHEGLDITEKQSCHDTEAVERVAAHLKEELESLVLALFGNVRFRWVTAYFPFTSPSWELEIYYNNDWLEVLGCGVMQQHILDTTGNSDKIGWAFGIGLERIAMVCLVNKVLFQISDIRLFWSEDPRFLGQFKDGKVVAFKPFSKYPVCYKDVSFWINSTFHENDFMELCRECCGDVVEKVSLIDTFEKKGRISKCYRVEYRSMDKTLTNDEVDKLHARFLSRLASTMNIDLR